MPVLIAVWGSSPGIGKSTLCAGLERWLTGAGLRADHFGEEEILTRPQYAAVAREFQSAGTAGPATLLAATRRYADSILAGGIDAAIADALMPYTPSLLAMGHSDQAINAFMSRLSRILAPLRPVMIFLDGDAGTALSRAAAREDPGWLDWYIGKLARYQVTRPFTTPPQPRGTCAASARSRSVRPDATTGTECALVAESSDILYNATACGVAAIAYARTPAARNVASLRSWQVVTSLADLVLILRARPLPN